MWAIASVLLGLLAASALIGFHVGPHAHAASTIFGTLAAVALVILAFTGHADPLLFGLLGADAVITGGVAAIAVKGFAERELLASRPADRVVGSFGTAIDRLDPDGTVRVAGEVWSATALNPPVPAGSTIHAIRRTSVRLEVWGDTGAESDELFSIAAGSVDEATATNEPDNPATTGADAERKPSP